MATAKKTAAKPATKEKAKPAAPKSAAKAKPADIARELGAKLRQRGTSLQIDFGYFDLKQNGNIVGQVVVSKYINGVIIPGQSMEYYYLYVASSGVYAPFTWPSKSNSPENIEFVFQNNGPGPTFDPVQYQYDQPVSNQLIACTCVDMGIVNP